MCSRKCFRMPTLVICGVVLTIVLVCITGITLTNSINISNIVKLREKVASDSAAANGGHQAAQTRAALVEQQYSTLQQHHLSKSDLNYISAATHPKNMQRLLATTQPQQPQPNKIVIEIGLRNSGSGNNDSSSSNADNLMPRPHMLHAADALMEGNVDSISLPAAGLTPTTTRSPPAISTTKPTTTTRRTITTTAAAAAADTIHNQAGVLGIADHNPAGIQFDRRAHVKQVMSKSMHPHPHDTPQQIRKD